MEAPIGRPAEVMPGDSVSPTVDQRLPVYQAFDEFTVVVEDERWGIVPPALSTR